MFMEKDRKRRMAAAMKTLDDHEKRRKQETNIHTWFGAGSALGLINRVDSEGLHRLNRPRPKLGPKPGPRALGFSRHCNIPCGGIITATVSELRSRAPLRRPKFRSDPLARCRRCCAADARRR
jgi:hypothetical protein